MKLIGNIIGSPFLLDQLRHHSRRYVSLLILRLTIYTREQEDDRTTGSFFVGLLLVEADFSGELAKNDFADKPTLADCTADSVTILSVCMFLPGLEV